MRRTRPLRLATTATAALAALTLVAGCGGGSDDASGGSSASASASTTDSTSTSASTSASTSTSGSPSASASTSDSASATASSGPTSSATGAAFAALSGQEIADTAKATMLTLKAVHYQGTIATSDDSSSSSPSASASTTGGTSTIKLDIRAKSDGECAGQVGIEGGRVTVLAANGTSYFKADRKFWQAAAGSAADQIIAGVGNKWVLDSNGDFGQFCALDQFLSSLFSATAGTQYAAKDTSSIGGQDVVAVERTATDDSPSTGYVLTGAKHYLVRISRTSGTQRGQLDFSGFDQDFTVQTPPADDIIDPSTLAAGS